MDFSGFLELLAELKHAGPDGFEGLVAQLLESLTGERFHLSKSGYQGGRDMSSAPRSTYAECKHYFKSKLNKRALLGELEEAHQSNPMLEVWILVTSTRVDSLLKEALDRAAGQKGISVIYIDSEGDDDSQIALLWAHNVKIFRDFLISQPVAISSDDMDTVFAFLSHIRERDEFKQNIEQLRREISDLLITYEQCRKDLNRSLKEKLSSKDRSLASFRQDLSVAAPETLNVPRKEVDKGLDDWFQSWRENKKPIVLLGEEGNGKSWALANWLGKKLDKPDFPPVLFLAARNIEDDELEKVFISQFEHGKFYPEKNKCNIDLLYKLINKREDDNCSLVLIIDGLNENTSRDWRRSLSEYQYNVAIITTCRTLYWNSYINLPGANVATLEVPPFNEKELGEALRLTGLKKDDIPDNVKKLIVKPRYFNLLVEIREKLAEYEEVTVDSIVYEDWKTRWSRRKPGSAFLDDKGFEEIVVSMAVRYRGSGSLTRNEIHDELKAYVDFSAIFADLETGRVIAKVKNSHGKYGISSDHLRLSLGLLLYEELCNIGGSSMEEYTEKLAKELEKIRGFAQETQICGAAFFFAIMDKSCDRLVRLSLLCHWALIQNHGSEDEERMRAYFPLDPELYFDAAEYIWSEKLYNTYAEDIFMTAMLKHVNQLAFLEIYTRRFEKWFGFVYEYGSDLQDLKDDKEKREASEKTHQSVGLPIGAQEWESCGLKFTFTDNNGLLRLSRVALAAISFTERKPFLKGIATSCLAGGVRRRYRIYETAAWVLRSTKENLWDEVKQYADMFIEASNSDSANFLYAARYILGIYGSVEALALRDTLPDPNKEWREATKEYDADWRKANLVEFLADKEEVNPYVINSLEHCFIDPDYNFPDGFMEKLPNPENIVEFSGLVGFSRSIDDHKFDSLLIPFARFSPAVYCRFIKKFASYAAELGIEEQERCLQRLNKHTILLGKEDSKQFLPSLETFWATYSDVDDKKKRERYGSEIALFKVVAPALSGEEQLELWLKRDADAPLYFNYLGLFKPVLESYFSDNTERLEETMDGENINQLLWFLSAHPGNIPADFTRKIYNYVGSDNSETRGLVLKIIYHAGDTVSISDFTNSDWSAGAKKKSFENDYGSFILCDYGLERPLENILERISPEYWWEAVKERLPEGNGIKIYADFLLKLYQNLQPADAVDAVSQLNIDVDVPEDKLEEGWVSLPSSTYSQHFSFVNRSSVWGGDPLGSNDKHIDWEKHQEHYERLEEKLSSFCEKQRAAGNAWFFRPVGKKALREVISEKPELVTLWSRDFFRGYKKNTILRDSYASFYLSLCGALMDLKPKLGITICKCLVSGKMHSTNYINPTDKLSILQHYIFSSEDSEPVIQFRKDLLQACINDDDLSITVYLAEKHGKTEWLLKLCGEMLVSEWARDKAFALCSLGYCDNEEAYHLLDKWLEENGKSWTWYTAKTSLAKAELNRWAKHWFEKYLEAPDNVEAWGHFQLFLKCVDRRYYLWKDGLVDKYRGAVHFEKRMSYLKENKNSIRKILKEQKNKEKEEFLAVKIPARQCHPWLSMG